MKIQEKCDMCGNPYPSLITYKSQLICPSCFANHKIFGCGTCTNFKCGFDENTELPHYIPQQTQQGVMTMITQIPNPALIEQECKFCCCWSEEHEICYQKEIGDCSQYKEQSIDNL